MVPLTILTELFIDGSWVDISADVRASSDISITRGRRDEGSATDPARMSLKLNNRHGRYSPRNPRSPYYERIGRNQPIRVAVQLPDGRMSYRFTGEVSKWPQQWDLSGNDAWVSIEASGILRRLRNGLPALKDVLTRATQTARPLAYWPMTEGPSAQYADEVMGGGGPFRYRPNGSSLAEAPLQGEGTLAPWLDPVLGMPDDSVTPLVAEVYTGDVTSDGWVADFAFAGTGPVCDFTFHTSGTNGVSFDWEVEITNDPSTQLISVSRTWTDDVGSSHVLLGDAPLPSGFTTQPNHIRLVTEEQVDSTTDWYLYLNGSLLLSGNQPFILRPVHRISALTQTNHPDGGGSVSIGHLAYWGLDNYPSAAHAYSALMGYSGETAGRRIERLCAEENVPVLINGDLDDTPTMGPQSPGRFLDLLREAETVDGGVLSEARNDMSLMYRTRTSRYATPTPAVVLDYAAGHIYDPFGPVEDDQRISNDVTVSRPNGGEARYVEAEGRMSVQVPPNGVGTYDASETLNVEADDQLPDQAAWRVHLGTVDEARYPRVTVNLLANPDLAADVANVVEADYFRIDNPPEWLPADPIRLIVEGYSERINLDAWSAEIVASPASPWTVGETPFDTLTEDFEDDTFAFPLLTTVYTPWQRDNTYAYRGSWSYRSGDIGHDGTSEFAVDVPPDAYQISFAYKLSSEEGWDKFMVLGDSALFSDSGEKDWQTVSIDVVGHSVIRFRYDKDSNTDTGEDAVWIDELSWLLTGDAADAGTAEPNRVDTDGSELGAPIDASQTLVPVSTTAGPLWTTDPAEMPFDVRVGGETMRVTSIDQPEDTFTRGMVAGWGVSSSGHTWNITPGSESYFAVDGSEGTVAIPTGFELFQPHYAVIDEFVSTYSKVSVDVQVNPFPAADSGAWFGLVLRTKPDRSEGYAFTVWYRGAGSLVFEVVRTDQDGDGATTISDSFQTLDYSDPIRMSAELNGTTLTARAVLMLPDSQRELVSIEVPDIPEFAGSPGVAAFPLYVDTRATVQVDNFIVEGQLFNVQRSVNGLVKAHSAGSDVRLAQPSIVAL